MVRRGMNEFMAQWRITADTQLATGINTVRKDTHHAVHLYTAFR